MIFRALFLLALISSFAAANKLSGTKPNIVYVLTDDQGMGDLSCMGNPFVQTPNVDAFYEKATRFTDFQVSPTCTPTRAALMSGRHPFEVGVSHTILKRERLSLDVVTLPEALKKAGYKNGLFGKWHLGDDGEEYLPQKRGFDEVFMHGAGGLCQGQYGDFLVNDEAKYFDNVILHNETIVKTEGFCTDVFFQAALGWMKKQISVEQPYFSYISLNAPHGPMYAREEDKKRFLDMGMDAEAATRYAMVENVDANFGVLMAKLEEWEQLENTLVIFMTDNGMSMSPFSVNGVKEIPYNAGMRGKKNDCYEGGTRVPSFWYWQGKTERGRDVSALVAHLDFYRTFCDLVGVLVPESKLPPRGRSLLPLLADSSAEWDDRTLFFHRGRWDDKWNKKTRAEDKYISCAVRTQKWRLVNDQFLYDVKNDYLQENDFSEQYPAVVKSLQSAYTKWWDATEPFLTNEGLEKQPKAMGEFYLHKLYEKQLSEKGELPLWKPMLF